MSSQASSQALRHWTQTAATVLDQMEAAHRAVRASGRGSRHATQQINQSYLMLLSSHFQQFCRSLHSEAVNDLVSGIDPRLGNVVRASLTLGRKLDQGNPNPSNLGSDFGRLGMSFWMALTSFQDRNRFRKEQLAKMGHWRNAIAHQDFTSATHAHELGGRTEITLAEVRGFRVNCGNLAHDFDIVVLEHVKALAGQNAG